MPTWIRTPDAPMLGRTRRGRRLRPPTPRPRQETLQLPRVCARRPPSLRTRKCPASAELLRASVETPSPPALQRQRCLTRTSCPISPPCFPFYGLTATQPHRNLRRVAGRLTAATVGGRALRSLGVLETRTVDPVDALVEATIEVVVLRVRGVTVVGPHDLLDARADDRIGGLDRKSVV